MRLDKFLAHAAGLSRTLAKQAIKQNRIVINTTMARSGSEILTDTDKILFDGEILSLPGTRYIMLHKPAGIVCTRSDSHHADIFSLIDNSLDLHAAGRLDADTTGLVLLTNDGQWSHRVTSPRHQHHKIYLVSLAQILTTEQQLQLTSGVMLSGENKPTLPATVEIINTMQIRLGLQEGKYHQVKRMLAAVGNNVTSLHRESIGDIQLNDLQASAWRELTPNEVDSFQ